MRLTLTKDLTPLRSAACDQIDDLAVAVRGRYITLRPSQDLVYKQKEKEAEMVSADPNVNPALVPHIVREADTNGVTLLDMATAVLIRANQWLNVSPAIEDLRLASKTRVEAATTPAAIDTVVQDARIGFGAL